MSFLPKKKILNQAGFVNLGLVIVALVVLAVGYLLFQNFQQQTSQKKPTAKKMVMMLVASDTQLPAVEGSKQGLSELGYQEGVNIDFKLYNPKGDKDLTKKMAEEIVAAKPDLVVPYSTTAAKTLLEARGDQPIPLVFIDVSNAKELNIADIKRPGHLMTGVANDSIGTSGKRMEILKEVVPNAKLFGVLINPENVSYQEITTLHEATAKVLGVKVKFYTLTKKEQLDDVLKQVESDKPDGLMSSADALFSNNAAIIALALKQAKIPSIDFNAERGVKAGYLMMFGVYRVDTGKQGARLIDKVLKGEDPGQIPVEFASAQKLEVNNDLAKELNITWPESILLRLKEPAK